ncbi:peptidoglycan DD-metalloendopeptidase family protein [Paracoccus sp. S-4012]|uniref:murein hydrolase activator EnvC family protein n=1 Tax=Paracoccus sp. S-4012 TaxID=2665648 RepID=UPI0012B055B1|nr:peptidoglycan DD-metalloendopeptidase family protein [Paracoccus sp. S-4012]MRX49298.1 peptidoglycan DD-metalloendopeptidase family protein [Paracoccus sp. S-4012]
MRRPFLAALTVAALIAAPAGSQAVSEAPGAQVPSAAATAAAETMAAAASIREATARLEQALSADDQVVALTGLIRAYEEAQAALRDGLRRASARESEIRAAFNARRDTLGRVLAVMATVERAPETTLLLHPAGAEATARSGLVMATVAPALQAEAEAMRRGLDEIAEVRRVQEAAAVTLAEGLGRVQEARRLLASAVTDRSTIPTRFLDDPAELQALTASADSLDALATGVASLEADVGPPLTDFEGAEGGLPMPVMGTVLRGYGEADRAGVPRPGIVVATRPRALVTTPWSATIRFRGPLLDYGNVMILEPSRGYLLVFAGLAQVFGETGDVLAAGDPVGLMGGAEGTPREFGVNFVVDAARGTDAPEAETLYIELRKGKETLDPADWFVANAVAPPLAPGAAEAEPSGDAAEPDLAESAADATGNVTLAPATDGAAEDGTDG